MKYISKRENKTLNSNTKTVEYSNQITRPTPKSVATDYTILVTKIVY